MVTDQNRRIPVPKPPSPTGNRFSHIDDPRNVTAERSPTSHDVTEFWRPAHTTSPEESPPEDRNRLSRLRPITHRIERQNTQSHKQADDSQG